MDIKALIKETKDTADKFLDNNRDAEKVVITIRERVTVVEEITEEVCVIIEERQSKIHLALAQAGQLHDLCDGFEGVLTALVEKCDSFKAPSCFPDTLKDQVKHAQSVQDEMKMQEALLQSLLAKCKVKKLVLLEVAIYSS